jgi:hypothetical protein
MQGVTTTACGRAGVRLGMYEHTWISGLKRTAMTASSKDVTVMHA